MRPYFHISLDSSDLIIYIKHDCFSADLSQILILFYKLLKYVTPGCCFVCLLFQSRIFYCDPSINPFNKHITAYIVLLRRTLHACHSNQISINCQFISSNSRVLYPLTPAPALAPFSILIQFGLGFCSGSSSTHRTQVLPYIRLIIKYLYLVLIRDFIPILRQETNIKIHPHYQVFISCVDPGFYTYSSTRDKYQDSSASRKFITFRTPD